MGHALVAMSLPGNDPVQKVSIIPRGISALGYTIQRPTEDRFLMGRDEMESRMAALLGGAREIDCAVRDLVGAAFETATEVLKRGRSVLERGARALLETESLGEAELIQLGQELPARKDVVARKSA
jgi:cell division protease FtsH